MEISWNFFDSFWTAESNHLDSEGLPYVWEIRVVENGNFTIENSDNFLLSKVRNIHTGPLAFSTFQQAQAMCHRGEKQ